ncbi:siderophore-interacting protein [Streptomyces boncukensis]|uniref:Siderophore-interacting protein n=1 Tax=Streptomyces boncukensis TaxID=2711219 RepID=A0A6G4WZI1_9ACTN|nr:siderophore-interacting protein [Streptomyces boncukensis]NGO70645.1 siderophore-interacting protein [Streptomyces boncukensis]
MSLLDRFLVRGTVARAEHGPSRFHRLTLTVPGPLPWKPGQHIRVQVGGVPGPRRTYSVWAHEGRTLQLYVLDHDGAGPGARWARAAAPGQRVLFGRPEGGLVTRPGARHLFVGDETASVAFGPMMRSLHEEGATVRGLLEVGEEADRLPLPDGADLSWRYRHGAPAAASPTLLAALAGLSFPAGRDAVAYVAGEARTVQAVRGHLVRERGWERRAVVTKPFWCPGKRGLD